VAIEELKRTVNNPDSANTKEKIMRKRISGYSLTRTKRDKQKEERELLFNLATCLERWKLKDPIGTASQQKTNTSGH